MEERQSTGVLGRSNRSAPASLAGPVPIDSIELEHEHRLQTTITEFDRVLGGGLVAGTLVLIGGDPGIGKSTLLLQSFNRLANEGKKVLYDSGEESLRQTKMRAERLGIAGPNLFVQAETSLEAIIRSIMELKPLVVVTDSIQTMFIPELQSAPGTISQPRRDGCERVPT